MKNYVYRLIFKLEILEAPLLVVQSFRSPSTLLLVLKYTNFQNPPSSPTIFSEPPLSSV